MDRPHQKQADGAIIALEEQGVDTAYAIKSSKSVKYL